MHSILYQAVIYFDFTLPLERKEEENTQKIGKRAQGRDITCSSTQTTLQINV